MLYLGLRSTGAKNFSYVGALHYVIAHFETTLLVADRISKMRHDSAYASCKPEIAVSENPNIGAKDRRGWFDADQGGIGAGQDTGQEPHTNACLNELKVVSADLSHADFLPTIRRVTDSLDVGLLISNAAMGAMLRVPVEELLQPRSLNRRAFASLTSLRWPSGSTRRGRHFTCWFDGGRSGDALWGELRRGQGLRAQSRSGVEL